MSHYIMGVSGACVDCSADDPCAVDSCAEVYPTAENHQFIRLRDVEYSGAQIFIFYEPTGGGIRAVSYDGSYEVGATLDAGLVGSSIKSVCRTSHSGNTFAVMEQGYVHLFSVNTSTLAITKTSSAITNSMTGSHLSMCFTDDDEVLIGSMFSLGSPFFTTTQYYRKGTVTGGGTGMSFSSAVSPSATVLGPSAFKMLIDRTEDGKAVSVVVEGDASGLAMDYEAVFIDNSGATPSLSAKTNLVSSVTGSLAIFYSDDSDGGCMFMYQENSNYYKQFFKNNSVGAKLSVSVGEYYHGLTSSTTGVSLNVSADTVTPFTVSGTTIVFGTPVSDATISAASKIRGNNASTASLTKTSANTEICVLT